MKIDRSALTSDLASFANNGNGVVIGQPGVGKSYSIALLRDYYKQRTTPYLILLVERLGAASEAEIRNVLKRDGDFVDLLKKVFMDIRRAGVLVFDGFDAARGEKERAGVLKMVSRAVNELRGSWNTIVTVRTFDAKKSTRLLELFPDEAIAPDAHIPCRHFLIPPFTEADFQQAFQQLPALRILYDNGTPEFRKLLEIPFNLRLADHALRSGALASDFSTITSEVQLLGLYWQYRVKRAELPEDREFFLTVATRLMVESHTLTARRDRIYRPDARVAWLGLLSDELFHEIEDGETRIAFAHNILFDYAVSILLLDPDPEKFAQFVAEEPARPLFLRPSLVYHFTRLWHSDRASFWRNYWRIGQKRALHLRQIIRIVLPAVVINEAKMLTDLHPIHEALTAGNPDAPEAIAFLLQGLRVVKPRQADFWVRFIAGIISHLSRRFAWDAGVLLLEFLEKPDLLSEADRSACGEFGRALLKWTWESRGTPDGSWGDHLARTVAIPLVAKTYRYNVNESRALFSNVLDILDEAGFPIDTIWRLCHEMEHFLRYDPVMVSGIYERVFSHIESSDERTNMGGPVLPLISNRRQDFNGCHFVLVRSFPSFLSAWPFEAIQTGLRILQTIVVNDHVRPYLRPGSTVSEMAKPFSFAGRPAKYLPDFSRSWGGYRHSGYSFELVTGIFDWLGNAVKQDREDDIERFLQVFSQENQIALLWARLLTTAAQNPERLGCRVWELLVQRPVLEGPDCLHAVAVFLQNAAVHLPAVQILQIEEAILKMPSNFDESEKREWAKGWRNRLLAQIPISILSIPESLAITSGSGETPQASPHEIIFMEDTEPASISDAKFLRIHGIEPDLAGNREVLALEKPIQEWLMTNRPESKIDQLLPTALELRQLIAEKREASEAALSRARMSLASFAAKAVVQMKSVESPSFQSLRSLVLAATCDPLPEEDSQASDSNTLSWTSAPRHEAAEVLPWLAQFSPEPVVLRAIEALANDPVPTVRFSLLSQIWRLRECAPELMWKILFRLAEEETSSTALRGLTASLWNLPREHRSKCVALIERLYLRFGDAPDDEDDWRKSVATMITDFAIRDHESWSLSTVQTWRESPLQFSSLLSVSGHRMIAYVTPQQQKGNLERAVALLLLHIDAVAQSLVALQSDSQKLPLEEIQAKWRQLYSILDDIVLRIYIASDVSDQLRQSEAAPLTHEVRERFFRDSVPLLERVLQFAGISKSGMLLAPTAHHFMQLLNGVLPYDPALVLRLASEVVTYSKRFDYNLDHMTLDEMVKLVESILADHQTEIQDDSSVNNLLTLLDAFVEAGWPQALNLVWRLDEVYR